MDIRTDIDEIKKSVSQLQLQFGQLMKMVEQSMSVGFSEAYSTIKQKVENIDTENKEVKSKVDIIEKKVEEVEEKTEKIEQKVDKGDALLRKELEETKKRMRILENTISSEIRKQVASILQEITRMLDPFIQKVSSLTNSSEIIEEYNQIKDKFEKSYGIKR